MKQSTTNTHPVAAPVDPCIDTRAFDANEWTLSLYRVVEKKNSSTLSARGKALETQGLVAAILLQDSKTVLETLDNAIMDLPAGTETKTVIIRSNVSESDPVPKRCKYVNGEWVTEEKKNVRQIVKSAITSAYKALVKRSEDSGDSYNIPDTFLGYDLSWSAAPGDKNAGCWLLKKIEKPVVEEVIEDSSIKPAGYWSEIYANLRGTMALNRLSANVAIKAIIEQNNSLIKRKGIERLAKKVVETDRLSAYQKAMKLEKIATQFKAMSDAGITNEIALNTLVAQHGENYRQEIVSCM